MERSEKEFDIANFSEYRKVEGQYTDTFIKSSRCVKINEKEDIVNVAIVEKSNKNIKVLEKAHYPKKVVITKVKDSEYAEFVGKYVEKVERKEKKEEESTIRLEEVNGSAPAVNTINSICLEAIRKKASDIHIQARKDYVEVRMRIDGVLQSVRKIDKSIYGAISSRIKVMAALNLMENRLCQDGRMSVETEGRKIDLRVSIVPSVAGQNIVLRLFKAENEEITLEKVGFSKENLEKIQRTLVFPNGMILATGPTGSGKTTTLHAMLNEMDKEHLKIVTIEDPVEKQIDGIEQIQVNESIGLTFENILRRVLRQDPDVIMVGEIRDRETAELAVRAALTGHLILSTLHTNDSVGVVARLKNLGIEAYLISGVLRTSIAQRLVRKICKECKGVGCENCENTGYKGRTAISEVFFTDEEISQMIEDGKNGMEIRKFLEKRNFKDIRYDAKEKIKEGITDEEEIKREGLF